MPVPLAWNTFGSRTYSAPTILLLHGFMGCGKDWQPFSDAVAAKYQLLCPDLPGHGNVRHIKEGADSTIEIIAQSIVDQLPQHCQAPVIVGGYSMGGRLALYLALQYLNLFSGLVLISSSPGIAEPEARNHRLNEDELLAERLLACTPSSNEECSKIISTDNAFECFLRDWYRQPIFCTLKKRPTLLNDLISRRLQNNPQSLAASLRGMGVARQPSLWKDLFRLSSPLLLITGAEDLKFSNIAEQIKNQVPESIHHSISTCSHCVHEEAPDRVFELMADFFYYAIKKA